MITNETFCWIFWIAGGFIMGGIMFSAILPRLLLQVDVAAMSPDRNPGSSNVFTFCGIPMGLLCLAADMLKGFLPVFLASQAVDPSDIWFAAVLAAPVLGHALAPLNHFHGGKCIATAFGEMLALLPLTRIVLVLAGLYILFSAVIRVRPMRYCSMLTFALFGIISVIHFLSSGRPSLALGCLLIAMTAVLRHTRYLSHVPEDEQQDCELHT